MADTGLMLTVGSKRVHVTIKEDAPDRRLLYQAGSVVNVMVAPDGGIVSDDAASDDELVGTLSPAIIAGDVKEGDKHATVIWYYASANMTVRKSDIPRGDHAKLFLKTVSEQVLVACIEHVTKEPEKVSDMMYDAGHGKLRAGYTEVHKSLQARRRASVSLDRYGTVCGLQAARAAVRASAAQDAVAKAFLVTVETDSQIDAANIICYGPVFVASALDLLLQVYAQ